MARSSRTHALAAGILLAASLAFAPALSALVLPIGLARHLPLGTVVTVEGSVTVPSGTFSSSSFDEGFAIQDLTGGIYVSVPDDLGLGLRAQVRATGQLVDSFGLLTLVPAASTDVHAHGKGLPIVPIFVRTGRVGEATEGLLVQVVGTIVAPIEPDPPFGTKVEVDDGSGPIRVFVNSSTTIDVSHLAQGQVVSVVGFSSQFIDAEIDPRFPSDIVRRH